jgi:hypothetical protein
MTVQRRKSRFKSARAAWADIERRSRWRPRDVVKAEHTASLWRWRVKKR